MALMSLVCPEKVCLQAPSLTSHSLARESQAPEMKVFMSGDRARDMQSPMWLVKITFCLPVSRSHRQLSRRERGMRSEKTWNLTSVEIQWDSASGNASWQVLNAKSFQFVVEEQKVDPGFQKRAAVGLTAHANFQANQKIPIFLSNTVKKKHNGNKVTGKNQAQSSLKDIQVKLNMYLLMSQEVSFSFTHAHCCFSATGSTHQVVSPEAVRISLSLRKRQQDR